MSMQQPNTFRGGPDERDAPERLLSGATTTMSAIVASASAISGESFAEFSRGIFLLLQRQKPRQRGGGFADRFTERGYDQVRCHLMHLSATCWVSDLRVGPEGLVEELALLDLVGLVRTGGRAGAC